MRLGFWLPLLMLAACGGNPALKKISADLSEMATQSSCAAHSWKDRGQAPSSYMIGMSLVFAKSLCRYKSQHEAGLLMAKAPNDPSKDALALYQSQLQTRGIGTLGDSTQTLRALYTLGIGLGMRESTGKHCQGYDTSTNTRTSRTAEAGPFQTSYDSHPASPVLTQLFEEYRKNDASCFLEVFGQGVSCSDREIVGSGEGAVFQRLAKSCPAFATEYAMVTLRVLRQHYGPVNRQEVEVEASCEALLRQVESYVDSQPEVCTTLL